MECKDTEVVKYIKIDCLAHYRWVPWKTKPCTCTKIKEK